MLEEIILRFKFPRSLKSDSRPSFVSKVTQSLTSVLGITYKLHSSWRPQSLGKAQRANQTLKRTLGKLCQETSEPWLRLLLIAFLHCHPAPEESLQLSPYEMLYGRPLLTFDLLLDSELNSVFPVSLTWERFNGHQGNMGISTSPRPAPLPTVTS